MSVEFDTGGEEQHAAPEAEAHEDEDAEKEARHLGWVPKEEFRGTEKHWVDADTFLERGRQILPILKQNNKALTDELKASRAEISEMQLTMREFSEMYKKMSESAYTKAMADIKAQIRQAQNAGDYDVADQLTDQYDQLKEDSKNIKVPEVKAPSVNPEQAAWNNIVEDWTAETNWYGKDKTLTRQMDAIARELAAGDATLLGTRRLLEKAEKQLREELPDRFTNPRRATGSPVTGASSSSAGSRGASASVRDLPAEAKASGQRMVKQGLFKDLAEYAKAYFDDTKDVIS